MPRQNIYVSEDTRERLEALAGTYGGMSAAIEEAVARLHRYHYPPSPPKREFAYWVIIVLPNPSVCADTGIEIPAGVPAYREIWKEDGKFVEGDILSKESLIADGIIMS